MMHREFLTWEAWFQKQWNRPSRSDFYEMQTACQVARVLAKNPANIKIEHFKLPFGEDGTRKQKELENKKIAESAKAGWAGILSAKLGKVIDTVTGRVKED